MRPEIVPPVPLNIMYDSSCIKSQKVGTCQPHRHVPLGWVYSHKRFFIRNVIFFVVDIYDLMQIIVKQELHHSCIRTPSRHDLGAHPGFLLRGTLLLCNFHGTTPLITPRWVLARKAKLDRGEEDLKRGQCNSHWCHRLSLWSTSQQKNQSSHHRIYCSHHSNCFHHRNLHLLSHHLRSAPSIFFIRIRGHPERPDLLHILRITYHIFLF